MYDNDDNRAKQGGPSKLKQTSSAVKRGYEGVWRWVSEASWDLGLDASDKFILVRGMRSRHMMMIGPWLAILVSLDATNAYALVPFLSLRLFFDIVLLL